MKNADKEIKDPLFNKCTLEFKDSQINSNFADNEKSGFFGINLDSVTIL